MKPKSKSNLKSNYQKKREVIKSKSSDSYFFVKAELWQVLICSCDNSANLF